MTVNMQGKRKQRFGRIAPNLCAYLFVLADWQKEGFSHQLHSESEAI